MGGIRDLCVHGRKCEFVLTEASAALANAIRRSLLDVPSAAISRVRLERNDTPFPDELLAHRLGMVPLLGPAGSTSTCRFRLCREGPCDVLSDDLVLVQEEEKEEQSLTPAHGVLVCPLAAGQRLEVEAECEVGPGSRHARFMQVVAPAYALRHRGVCVPECFCDSTPPSTARCKQCGRTKPGVDVLAGQPLEYHFRFETVGADPRWVLEEALVCLHARIAAVSKGLSKHEQEHQQEL